MWETGHSAMEMQPSPRRKGTVCKGGWGAECALSGLKLRLAKRNKGKTVPYVSLELALLLYKYANTNTHVLQKIAEN